MEIAATITILVEKVCQEMEINMMMIVTMESTTIVKMASGRMVKSGTGNVTKVS